MSILALPPPDYGSNGFLRAQHWLRRGAMRNRTHTKVITDPAGHGWIVVVKWFGPKGFDLIDELKKQGHEL